MSSRNKLETVRDIDNMKPMSHPTEGRVRFNPQPYAQNISSFTITHTTPPKRHNCCRHF